MQQVMKKITLIVLLLCSSLICSCTKEEKDSVLINIQNYEAYAYENVENMDMLITKDSCRCYITRDNIEDVLKIDDYISDKIYLLADSFFFKESIPMYSHWKKIDTCEFHEGDVLIFYITINGEKKTIFFPVYDIYQLNKLQMTEDYHEFIYSNSLLLFLQYIDLIQSFISGQRAWFDYIEDLRYLNRTPYAYVFPEIMQVCDSLANNKDLKKTSYLQSVLRNIKSIMIK